MGKNREKYPEIAVLHEQSLSDIIAVYDSEEEANEHIRQQLFQNMESETAKRYHGQSSQSRRIVNDLICSYLRTTELHGFNLSVFYSWLNESGGTLSQIANHICDARMEGMGKEEKSKKMDKETVFLPESIYHRLCERKGTKSLQKSDGECAVINALCNCFLISSELLLTGRGTINEVKPGIIEIYNQSPDYYLDSRSSDGTLLIAVKEEFEYFAEHLGKAYDDIMETKYAVLNYTYGYSFLEEPKFAEQKKVVDSLIDLLYTKEENERQSRSREQELYLRLLNNGLRKNDYATLVKLTDKLYESLYSSDGDDE